MKGTGLIPRNTDTPEGLQVWLDTSLQRMEDLINDAEAAVIHDQDTAGARVALERLADTKTQLQLATDDLVAMVKVAVSNALRTEQDLEDALVQVATLEEEATQAYDMGYEAGAENATEETEEQLRYELAEELEAQIAEHTQNLREEIETIRGTVGAALNGDGEAIEALMNWVENHEEESEEDNEE